VPNRQIHNLPFFVLHQHSVAHGTLKAGLSVGTGQGDLDVADDVLEQLAARRP